MSNYIIKVLVLDPSGQPLSKHRLELWDHNSKKDDFIGQAETDAEGRCIFRFDEKTFKDKNGKPDVYFKVFKEKEFLSSTRGATVFNLGFHHASVTLRLGATISIENTKKADQVPFKAKDLKKSVADFKGKSRAFIHQKLNAALANTVQAVLKNISPKLQDAVKDISIDHTVWIDKTLDEVIRDGILPSLAQNPDTKPLVEAIDWEKVRSIDKRPIHELLQLETPIQKNPIFRAEVRILKTTELVNALELNEALADQLLENSTNWERATAANWNQLVAEDVLTEQERNTLQRGFMLSQFTGGNAKLSAALHNKFPIVQDVVKWEVQDWKKAIRASKDGIPKDVSIAQYAENLHKLAQRNYPSAFFLERKVKKALPAEAILKDLKKLPSATTISAVKKKSRKVAKAPTTIAELPLLRSIANTYRHLGVEAILTDPQLSPEAKVETIAKKQGYLRKFVNKNPGFDLRSADFFSKDETGELQLRMTGIPKREESAVRNQMMAYQRVQRLGNSYAVQEALLAAGLDSANEIVQRGPNSAYALMDDAISRADFERVLSSAQRQYSNVVHAAINLQGLSSENFMNLTVLDYPEDFKNHLQSIDGYADIFGNQNYCTCDHCKSIFGPAAYFVDLMRFVDVNVELAAPDFSFILDNSSSNNQRDQHPISLAKRRPDLWHLELSCENTNRPVPYLSLINKIKITYLSKVLNTWQDGLTYDENADRLWAEIAQMQFLQSGIGTAKRLQYSNTNTPTITAGVTWKNGFRAAFNRPFEESLIWLDALGVDYKNLLLALRVDETYHLEAAYLGLSKEEWKLITVADTSLNDLVEIRFAFPEQELDETQNDYFDINKCSMVAFKKATALSREEAEDLLSMTSLLNIDSSVRLVREAIPNDIQAYKEWIEGLNSVAVLDFIHRFVRLWRHMPDWSIQELNLAVERVGELSPEGVAKLARMAEVQQVLGFNVEESIAMQGNIPNSTLYTRKVRNEFLNISVEEQVPGMLDRLFDPSSITIPTLGSTINLTIEDLTLGGQLPFVLRGLGVTEAEFERVLNSLSLGQSPKLQISTLSACFRFIRAARALKLSIEEFSYLYKLQNPGFDITPNGLLQLIPLVKRVKSMPLSLHEMWFISRSADSSTKNSKITSAYVQFDQQGNPVYHEAANTASDWTASFFENESLYISQETLKSFLPAEVRETNVAEFIAILGDANIILAPTSGSNEVLRVLRRDVAYDESDIPTSFYINSNSTTSTQVQIDIELEARQAFAELLNTNHILDSDGHSTQARIIRETLGQLLNIEPGSVAKLSDWSGLFTGVLVEIEDNWLRSTGFVSENLKMALPELERLALFFKKAGLGADDLDFVKNNAEQFFTSSTTSFLERLESVEDFLRFGTFKVFKNKADGLQVDLLDFYAILTDKNGWYDSVQNIAANYTATLAQLVDCESGQLMAIFDSVPLGDFSPKSLDALSEIEGTVKTIVQLGIYEKDTLLALRANDYSNALVYEKPLQAAFKTRSTNEGDFEKAAEPFAEKINELRRDVLCSFLLALYRDHRFDDTNDLYAYFLVDVEMSGCAMVSEILAATLSLQLYVHRVLMGLEASVQNPPTPRVRAFLGNPNVAGLSDLLRKQWEWRKNYRVWEANGKVATYCENWIEPELRDDKSPLFKTLEEELLQQKITMDSAEGAYKTYLKGFAEIGQLVIAGIYYEEKPKAPIYHIFGRTATDPYQYFYRKLTILGMPEGNEADNPNNENWVSSKKWTPWEKVDLAIESPYVSPVVYRNKIHLFWVSDVAMAQSKFEDGDSLFEKYKQTFALSYSFLDEKGKWLQPQKVKDFLKDDSEIVNSDQTVAETTLKNFEGNYLRYRLFPKVVIDRNKISIDYLKSRTDFYTKKTYVVNFFKNKVTDDGSSDQYHELENHLITSSTVASSNGSNMLYQATDFDSSSAYMVGDLELDFFNASPESPQLIPLAELPNFEPDYPMPDNLSPSDIVPHDSEVGNAELRFVFNQIKDNFFRVEDEQFLIRSKLSSVNERIIDTSITPQVSSTREVIRLNSTIIDKLQGAFYELGLDKFLSVDTQLNPENSSQITYQNNYLLLPPDNFSVPSDALKLDFKGSTGGYFRELFFHIPFTIADHLNTEGKFKEADFWYRKIFDPSASHESGLSNPTDRYWRFLEFRDKSVPSLMDMLSDTAVIHEYNNNPFNPHAIARLRISAYQKSIVMRYIDNLIDWADSLFRRDTWESNSEAMMLYTLAKDILGNRPEPLGNCETAIGEENCGCSHPTTYAAISSSDGFTDSPFISFIENWIPHSHADIVMDAPTHDSNTGGGNMLRLNYAAVSQENASAPISEQVNFSPQSLVYASEITSSLGQQMFRMDGQKLLFCIPHNENMLAYWDRVEDRLFKLRHCMNIDGVKRSQDLYSPKINPALLVAAFASGLTIEDVLGSLYNDLPAYRFSYLVEKAKYFAGTVQSFGGALLSALEKKDSEALTLLRSTQEQNIMKMTKDVKKKAIEETKAHLEALTEGMMNIINRHAHYFGLIETGLINGEKAQQKLRAEASLKEASAGTLKLQASYTRLVTQLGAVTAMTYGGEELGSAMSFASEVLNFEASQWNSMSNAAGIEAGNKRREQEWKQQLKTAEQELKQAQKQIAAATIRLAIAEKDLEIHENQLEHAIEVHDFYKNKMTGLGLYTYMAKQLNQLHRMAFNAAMEMAKQAEAAYKFETDDQAFMGISGGTFWDASRVGLLSGESLTLELQQLEANFINWNKRQMEIRQSFSMRIINPEALLNLRNNGRCTFIIPEWAFDMQYPGHYRRRIVSVQITIPCVAGPYHNIAAILSMTKGKIKKGTTGTDAVTESFPFRGSSLIATSSANNDGGQFDLNFRDERFLPFEGAGAVDSEWVLELPENFRSFDYDTISDVIFHINYRSKYDGGPFKTDVVGGLLAAINDGYELKKLISLKEEFPDAHYQLSQLPANDTAEVTIELTKQHFPFWANGFQLRLSDITDKSEQCIVAFESLGTSCQVKLKVGSEAVRSDVLLICTYELEVGGADFVV